MSKILEEDFNYILGSLNKLEKLKNSTILVTGATGLIGSLIVKVLNYMNKNLEFGVEIIALIRNEEKAKNILNGCNLKYIIGDLSIIDNIDEEIDYIIHCAAITKSKEMINKPVEVTEGIVLGTNAILRLGHKKKIKSMVYLSSMEVYGHIDSGHKFLREEELGTIEVRNVRNCYPLSKKMAENLCYSYHSEYKVPVKIARLVQTFGAGILSEENRIFAQFANSVIKNEDIILHTEGLSMGNYCYTADAIKGIMLLLLNGIDGEVYNIVNESNCMTIKEMANLVSDIIANNKIHVKYNIQHENECGYGIQTNMKLSSQKIRELGWSPKYDMEDMYKRMITYMREV